MKIEYKQWVAGGGYRIIGTAAIDITANGYKISKPTACHLWRNPADAVLIEKASKEHRAVDFTKLITKVVPSFAQIQTPDDIIKFANEYGPIGMDIKPGDGILYYDDAPRSFAATDYDAPTRFHPVIEPISSWFDWANAVRDYLKAIESESMEEVAKVFRIHPGGLENKKQFLERHINMHCNARISPIFRDGDFRLYAHNLLGAIWGEISQIIARKHEIRRCHNPHCPKPFFIVGGEDGQRRDAVYCSKSCYNAFHNPERRRATRSKNPS